MQRNATRRGPILQRSCPGEGRQKELSPRRGSVPDGSPRPAEQFRRTLGAEFDPSTRAKGGSDALERGAGAQRPRAESRTSTSTTRARERRSPAATRGLYVTALPRNAEAPCIPPRDAATPTNCPCMLFPLSLYAPVADASHLAFCTREAAPLALERPGGRGIALPGCSVRTLFKLQHDTARRSKQALLREPSDARTSLPAPLALRPGQAGALGQRWLGLHGLVVQVEGLVGTATTLRATRTRMPIRAARATAPAAAAPRASPCHRPPAPPAAPPSSPASRTCA